MAQADHFKVSVTADENVLGHVKVAREGSRLKVALEEGKNYRLRKDSLRVAIALPSLEEVGLRNGALVMLGGFKGGKQFKAEVAAGSTLEGAIEAGDFLCRASHGGRIALEGKGRDAKLIATASGTLDLARLALQGANIRVELAHGSTASINAMPRSGSRPSSEAASTLKGTLEAGDIVVEVAHGGRIALEGKARDAKLVATASGTLDLARLALQGADVQLEHGSSATVGCRVEA